MKKMNYEAPYLEILVLNGEDVITTSLSGENSGSEVLINFNDFVKKGKS